MSAVAVANGLDKLDAPPLTVRQPAIFPNLVRRRRAFPASFVHQVLTRISQQSDAVASLLSLSFSEGGLAPRDATAAVAPKVEPAPHQPPLAPAPSTSVPLSSSLSNGGKHHRRLSSTGKTRRRLSDAREAANRPSPSLLSSTSGLASLSLSSSPPPGSYPAHLSSSFTGASRKLAPAPPNPTNSSNHGSSGGNPGSIPIKSGEEETNDTGAIPIPSANGRTGKKRGIDHKCESCSKAS
ncbi:hypothetical protein CC1G_15029 [Coprinopsis cinerea okayama7|uniref:Uncharacterized protein n=1 Tax=Coprinopsis cinerea (strain Okayama-7 / 130 / ATCC MYA-4618 / FGSC 9003) TaxID=240176 RepID=D6RPD6_COPC7|nr:hypothetical protein CC1G_15029 [Coprinopsis cinerea okayama7\|eukprot:XP_002910698.1 hypothetical protein CC1G_15029 [Coprinopsis cinerea okayama7\